MKKFLLSAAIAFTGLMTANAQSDWQVGDEITDKVEWGNLSFENDPFDYWTLESASGSFTTTGANLFEVYDGSEVDLYQVVKLPAGMYKVECQAYYRCGNSWDDDPNTYNGSNGKEWEDNALLYAKNGTYDIDSKAFTVGRTFKCPLMPRLFPMQTSQLYEDTVKEGWDMSDGSYTVAGQTVWGPCSVPGSKVWFEAGLYGPYDDGDGTKYNTTTFFLTEDGYAKIGISKTNPRSADSFMATNFKLYYMGEAGEAAELMALQDEAADIYNTIAIYSTEYAGTGLLGILIDDAILAIDDEVGSIDDLDSKEKCNEAIAFLNKVKADIEEGIASYKNIISVLPAMKLLLNSTDYDGKEAFQAAVDKADNLVSPEYNGDDDEFSALTKAYDELCAARVAYLMTQKKVNGAYDFSSAINFAWFCNNEYNPKWNEEKGYFCYDDEIENTWVAGYGEKSVKDVMSEHPDWIDITSNVSWTQKTDAVGEWIFNHHCTSGWMGGIDNVTMQHGFTAVGAWSGDPIGGYQEMRQVIAGLPTGYYAMGAYYINAGNEPHEGQYVYINAGDQPNDETMEKAQFTHKGTHWWTGTDNVPVWRTDDWEDLKTNMVYVEDGKVVIGSRSTWFYAVTGFRLYYYGETPDFIGLLSGDIKAINESIDDLAWEGDKTAAKAIMAKVPAEITTQEGYQAALETLKAAKAYIAAANAAMNVLATTLTNFENLMNAQVDPSEERTITSTAWMHVFSLGDEPTDTYELALAAADDYTAYANYLDFAAKAKAVNDAAINTVITEQFNYLKENYADAAKLAEFSQVLAAPYNAGVLASLGADKATLTAGVDVTSLITNPKFENGTKGYVGDMTIWQDPATSDAIVERWNTNSNINQTIYSLPAGTYEVQLQAFYRDGGDANTSYQNWVYTSAEEMELWENQNAKLYANDQETSINSIASVKFTDRMTQYCDKMQEAAEADEQGNIIYEPHYVLLSEVEEGKEFSHPWDTNVDDIDEETAESVTYFYPNSTYGSVEFWKRHQDAYWNSVRVYLPETGDLTFGMKEEVDLGNDWVVMNQFKLIYLGTEAPTAISETAAKTVVPVAFYTVDGIQTRSMQKGINIVKMSDGSVKKVIR